MTTPQESGAGAGGGAGKKSERTFLVDSFYRWSELDQTTYPELRERVVSFEQAGHAAEPRSYPGYPRFALGSARPRRLVGLDQTLLRRRSARSLDGSVP